MESYEDENCQGEETAEMELPRYKCHKEVHALKIKDVVANPNQSLDLFFEESGYAPLNLSKEDMERKPTPLAGMYYVVYGDGYFSFSPEKAFVEGYSLVN